jgi:hypothetical protein
MQLNCNGLKEPKDWSFQYRERQKKFDLGYRSRFHRSTEILIDRRHDVSGTGLLAIKTNAPSIASAVTHIAVHRKINGNF